MTLVISEFRAQFPEFSDIVVYPDTLITFWAGIAEQMVVQNVWCDMWQTGVKLYTAHEITLSAQSQKTALVGGVPGQNGGVPSSKAVGSVNVSYDPNTTTEKDAGFWNLTTYGKQFYRLMQIFGAGMIQL